MLNNPATGTVAASGTTTSSSEEDKEYGKKKRIAIRFAIELFQNGVWPDSSVEYFTELLRSLLGKSKL